MKPAEPAAARAPGPADEPPMLATFAAVLALEVIVLLALWGLGRYFGSP